MYDLTFISYQEPNAEEHFALLKARFPRAKWVKDVQGIVAAHKAAAAKCRSKFFWVVDGDNVIEPTFDFSFKWERTESLPRVAVWRAINNMNGLEYGYGGIKLLPRKAVLDVPDGVTDFTTSISDHFHVMEEVASTTVINATPFDAWKSGFRECVKLASQIIKGGDQFENSERLQTWRSTVYDVPHHEHVLRGARQGASYGSFYQDDPFELARINDWEWLRERFHRQSAGD